MILSYNELDTHKFDVYLKIYFMEILLMILVLIIDLKNYYTQIQKQPLYLIIILYLIILGLKERKANATSDFDKYLLKR